MSKKTLLTNKKARYEYETLDKIEAGIVLTGAEAKSLRLSHGSINEAFVLIRDGEIHLHNANITGYKFADLEDYQPTAPRKLLLHKKQIESLNTKTDGQNLSIIPLEIYLNEKNRIKVLIALARGRKQFQKKEHKKRKDLERETRRDLKLDLR